MSPATAARGVRAGLGLAATAALLLCLAAPSAQAAFGFLPGAAGFDVAATELNGSIAAEAGSHPYALTTEIGLNLKGAASDGDLRDLSIERPAGLIENPTAVGTCTTTQFNTPRSSPFQEGLSGESCPDDSQVGILTVTSSFGGGQTRSFGVFSLVPPPGFPALLGVSPFGMPIVFAPRIRSGEGEYGISLESHDVSQQLNLSALKLTVWGNPWLVGHDSQRGDCLNETDPAAGFGEAAVLEREPQTQPPTPPYYEAGTCSVGNPKGSPVRAYLTLPSSCAGPMLSTVTATSWQQPTPVTRTALSHDAGGAPLALKHCTLSQLESEAATAKPTSDRAASAAGFDFNLSVNQATMILNTTETGRLIPETRASSQVKKAVVTLPRGMTINPSLAAGLGVCTPAQYAAETVSSVPGAGCPNESKIGEMTVQTPLFDRQITGGIFLAKPYDNPFGSLLAVYLVAKAPERGVIVKLGGEIQPDPGDGRLTATFDKLPQLPYSRLNVRFRDGQRSPLATPNACGGYLTRIDLSPWMDPAASLGVNDPFNLTRGPGGGSCPVAVPPFAPRAQSGTFNRNAGARSPFYLHLTRNDGEQEITSYSTTLPKGLLGAIAGVPFCPEAAIAAAAANSGFAETANPSCPAASKIGRTTAGYGLGSVLAYAPGGLYLAGPYHGSPLSIVAVDSATVGPFDLGVIIIRSAIRVDPITAQISIDSAGSDPIPHIIKGIPLHLRDIRVYIDRPNFMVNPTSCEHFAVASSLNGSGAAFSNPADDSTASVSNPFQVSFCSSLNFKPQMELRLSGLTRRGAYPSLRATVTPPPGSANIGRAMVTLPPSLFLEQSHIDTICSRPQSAAGSCPAASVYGNARAFTPLLDEPLEGPVYLRASENKLPDLVAELHGRGVRIDVAGRIDSNMGGMRATYDALPDAPVSKFVLTLKGGKHGLLVNSEDICKSAPGRVWMAAQSNATTNLRPRIVNAKCSKKKKAKRKTGRHPTKGRSAKR